MKKLNLFLLISFTFFIFSCSSLKNDSPNVIYILADDLGYGDVGFNGQKLIETPNIDYLASKNIHTSVHFKPLHKYEIIQKHMTHKDREFPVADKEWLKLVSLPVHPAMTEEDIEYVVYWVNKYFDDNL